MEEKKVSLWKSTLFTICSIMVLDTFVAPAIIGVSSITIWIVTAIIFFFPYGLLSSELGSCYPDDGGITSWVGRAYGEFTSVMVGWYYWVNVAFWMPAVFVAFAYWFSYAFAPTASSWVMAGIATLMCWLIVWIGIRGIELSVMVSNIFAVAKVAVLLIFGFMGIAYGMKNGLANDFSARNFIPSYGNTTQYIAAIVYNLLGFELIGSIGSKIHDPGKTIPRMTAFSGIIITALYVFGTFGVLAAVPADEVDTVDGFYFALEELCTVFGPAARPVFYIVIVVTMLTLVSNMVSWTLGANESLSASGLDSRSPFLAHRNAKYGTSDNLYIVMGVISTILIVLNFFLSEDANEIFWSIFSFSSLIFFLPYLFMFPAALTLRKKAQAVEDGYRVPGGTAGLTVCVVLCEACLLLSIFFLFKDAGAGFPLWTLIIGTLLTTLAGLWLYKAGEKH